MIYPKVVALPLDTNLHLTLNSIQKLEISLIADTYMRHIDNHNTKDLCSISESSLGLKGPC